MIDRSDGSAKEAGTAATDASWAKRRRMYALREPEPDGLRVEAGEHIIWDVADQHVTHPAM